MPKTTRDESMFQTTIRLDPELLAQVDDLIDHLSERHGGGATRASVIRQALVLGVREIQRDRAALRKIRE